MLLFGAVRKKCTQMQTYVITKCVTAVAMDVDPGGSSVFDMMGPDLGASQALPRTQI